MKETPLSIRLSGALDHLKQLAGVDKSSPIDLVSISFNHYDTFNNFLQLPLVEKDVIPSMDKTQTRQCGNHKRIFNLPPPPRPYFFRNAVRKEVAYL